MTPDKNHFSIEDLEKIRRTVRDFPPLGSNLNMLRREWESHVETVRRKIPEIQTISGGEGLYINGLSPGCRACKEGTWDCVFTTVKCNLDCQFCLSPPNLPENYAGSIFGTNPEEISLNHQSTRITGISFSGGEPFLNPKKLSAWIEWFKKRYPDKYYWVYTNGLLAEAKILKKIQNAGIDEIRFNAAATGYDHPVVMKNIMSAIRHIPCVTIEIPAIPEHEPKVMSQLLKWCQMGVKFLNMHELIYEPGTHSESLGGERSAVVSIDGHFTEINPKSRLLTLKIMERVSKENLPIAVNDCSMHSKMCQLRGRRQSIVSMVRSDHEKLIHGEFLEKLCAYQGVIIHCFHPDDEVKMRRQYPEFNYVRLVRTAPLSFTDPGVWVKFERLN